MGLEKKNIPGKLSPLNKSLALGRSQGTRSFWHQVCVSFIHTILAGECNASFFFFVIILLFSWKLHTGINRSSRSSLGHRPGLQMKTWKRDTIMCGSAEVVPLGHRLAAPCRLPPVTLHVISLRIPVWFLFLRAGGKGRVRTDPQCAQQDLRMRTLTERFRKVAWRAPLDLTELSG